LGHPVFSAEYAPDSIGSQLTAAHAASGQKPLQQTKTAQASL
jgi:hypothetical protein